MWSHFWLRDSRLLWRRENQEPDLGERVKAAPDREWEWG